METDPVPIYSALVTLNAFAVGCRCRVSCLSRRPNAALSRDTLEAVKLLRARFRKSKRVVGASDQYFGLYKATQDEAKAAKQAEAMAALLIHQEDVRKRRREKVLKKPTVKPVKKKQAAPEKQQAYDPPPSQLSFTIEPNAVVNCLSALGIELSIDDLEYLTRNTSDCDFKPNPRAVDFIKPDMQGLPSVYTYAKDSFW
jgi:hypothetical protein